MSRKARVSPTQMCLFEKEVNEVATNFQDRYEGFSHKAIAEGIGRVFAQHCLYEYGIKGFEYASHGINAILDALGEGNRRRGSKNRG
jgi:hypothetical protein